MNTTHFWVVLPFVVADLDPAGEEEIQTTEEFSDDHPPAGSCRPVGRFIVAIVVGDAGHFYHDRFQA